MDYTPRNVYKDAYRDVRMSSFRSKKTLTRITLSRNPYGEFAYKHFLDKSTVEKLTEKRYLKVAMRIRSGWIGRENPGFPWYIWDNLKKRRNVA